MNSAKDQKMNLASDAAGMGFSYASLWRDSRVSCYYRLADQSAGAISKLLSALGPHHPP
ncbi:MAG: hypothetical protein QS721_03705 [Candidatus Endonucleobacter sp. (ex Gigantidas childressi)]|nr:hypothetical protein [Candidatus Endonucleobacter sp. (ex Gigantidas childressi)]